MDKTDVNQLPRPLFEALQRALESALDLHDTLVQVYPAQPTAPYPRSAMEVLCLDALRAIEPLPATPKQVAAMINKPNDEVYRILLALEILGTIYRPDQGVLQHRGTTAFQWDAVPTHRRGTAQHPVCGSYCAHRGAGDPPGRREKPPGAPDAPDPHRRERDDP